MIAEAIVWELPFAPALGHPARVSGRVEVVKFAAWFVVAVENFRFFDVRVQAFADPEAAVAEVKGEGRIKATGRVYRQEYVVFLRASGGRSLSCASTSIRPGRRSDAHAHPRPGLLTP